MFFSVSNFPVLCRFSNLVYHSQFYQTMVRVSVHQVWKCTVLFFLCCLFPFEIIRGKNGKIILTEL